MTASATNVRSEGKQGTNPGPGALKPIHDAPVAPAPVTSFDVAVDAIERLSRFIPTYHMTTTIQ
jgi:hypothetical protein